MNENIRKLLIESLISEEQLDLSISPRNIVYHTSNPIHRNFINKGGLIPKQESWGIAIGSDMNSELGDKKAIFATNNGEHYDSTYDDDVWEINTSIIKNKWFVDKHFSDGIYTFDSIPRNAIKLIYKGTGNDKL